MEFNSQWYSMKKQTLPSYVINYPTVFVRECPKTENIGDGFIVVTPNQVWTWRCIICLAGIDWNLLCKRLHWGFNSGDRLRMGLLNGWYFQYRCSGMLRACALNAMARALHVALGCGRAGVEVLYNELLGQIRAPFKESSSRGFQQGGYFGIAQRLMCKFDSVCLHLYRVCEQHDDDSWIDVRGLFGWMWGATNTGAWLWQVRYHFCY
jgi:hypothetical protein